LLSKKKEEVVEAIARFREKARLSPKEGKK